MGVPSLLQNDVVQAMISVIVHKMFFASYARIIKIDPKDPLSVIVRGCVCNGSMPFTTKTKLVYPTTAFVQVEFKPVIGDKVLVVGLQSYSDLMFESPMTLTENEVNDVQHYTILGCVAIPLNIESAKAPIKVSNDATAITIGRSEVPGNDPVVRWSELNTELQNLVTLLNGHTHTGVTTGEGTSGPPGEAAPTPSTVFSLDISSAASDILKVPGA